MGACNRTMSCRECKGSGEVKKEYWKVDFKPKLCVLDSHTAKKCGYPDNERVTYEIGPSTIPRKLPMIPYTTKIPSPPYWPYVLELALANCCEVVCGVCRGHGSTVPYDPSRPGKRRPRCHLCQVDAVIYLEGLDGGMESTMLRALTGVKSKRIDDRNMDTRLTFKSLYTHWTNGYPMTFGVNGHLHGILNIIKSNRTITLYDPNKPDEQALKDIMDKDGKPFWQFFKFIENGKFSMPWGVFEDICFDNNDTFDVCIACGANASCTICKPP